MVGVPVRTLHTWERRYGLLQTVRRSSGHRLYDDFSVQEARCILGLMEEGVSLGSIADHPSYMIFRMRQNAPSSSPDPNIETPVNDHQMMEILGRIQQDIRILARGVEKTSTHQGRRGGPN